MTYYASVFCEADFWFLTQKNRDLISVNNDADDTTEENDKKTNKVLVTWLQGQCGAQLKLFLPTPLLYILEQDQEYSLYLI